MPSMICLANAASRAAVGHRKLISIAPSTIVRSLHVVGIMLAAAIVAPKTRWCDYQM